MIESQRVTGGVGSRLRFVRVTCRDKFDVKIKVECRGAGPKKMKVVHDVLDSKQELLTRYGLRLLAA